ncbi:hypothetical protein BJY01DRAFT_256045 [Aspergillus pseudoustus]|uniref:HNH nuclease domain-containing protein n=1 Tax=Aspergillus pseudoustus TaxID=1810923 RepID=A0ABR4IEY5_9EURO
MDSPQNESRSSSRASSNLSSGISSSVFSDAVKIRVKGNCGNQCWACEACDPQVCHAAPRDDRQAVVWFERHLFDFPINSYMNAIALCPNCHNQFDYSLDPGFAFIPVDIQYFIDFELADRERRKEARRNRDFDTLARRVPSAEDYRQHQLAQGVISSDSSSPSSDGGLYRPVFLKPIWKRPGFQAAIEYDRPWYGAPMASLRRAFPLLGSARSHVLGKATREALERLRNLYFDPEEDGEEQEGAANTRKRPTSPSSPEDEAPARKNRRVDKRDHHGGGELGGTERGDGVPGGAGPPMTFCPVLQAWVPANWSIGPNSTANDVIEDFGRCVEAGTVDAQAS